MRGGGTGGDDWRVLCSLHYYRYSYVGYPPDVAAFRSGCIYFFSGCNGGAAYVVCRRFFSPFVGQLLHTCIVPSAKPRHATRPNPFRPHPDWDTYMCYLSPCAGDVAWLFVAAGVSGLTTNIIRLDEWEGWRVVIYLRTVRSFRPRDSAQ